MKFEEAYDAFRPRMSKEELEAAITPPNGAEIHEMLDALDRRGANCDRMQNIVIEYLVNMVNDLHKRVSELEREEE